ncbi:MAG: AIR synthase related protein [Pseudomonadota bacterium]
MTDHCVDDDSEFGVINRYFTRDTTADERIVFGVGDDAAIVAMPSNARLISAHKSLCAGVDFERNAPSGELAPRLVRHAVAVLKQRGVEDIHFATLTITCPDIDPDWLNRFAAALHDELNTLGIRLVGGDTTEGPLTVGLTVCGWSR